MPEKQMLSLSKRPVKVVAKSLKCVLTGGHQWRLISDSEENTKHRLLSNGKMITLKESYICRRCRTIAWTY